MQQLFVLIDLYCIMKGWNKRKNLIFIITVVLFADDHQASDKIAFTVIQGCAVNELGLLAQRDSFYFSIIYFFHYILV